VQWFTFDNATGEKTRIAEATDWVVPAGKARWLAAEIRAARGWPGLEVVIRDGTTVVGRSQFTGATIISSR
jgi:hypothetical protein